MYSHKSEFKNKSFYIFYWGKDHKQYDNDSLVLLESLNERHTIFIQVMSCTI